MTLNALVGNAKRREMMLGKLGIIYANSATNLFVQSATIAKMIGALSPIIVIALRMRKRRKIHVLAGMVRLTHIAGGVLDE